MFILKHNLAEIMTRMSYDMCVISHTKWYIDFFSSLEQCLVWKAIVVLRERTMARGTLSSKLRLNDWRCLVVLVILLRIKMTWCGVSINAPTNINTWRFMLLRAYAHIPVIKTTYSSIVNSNVCACAWNYVYIHT